MKFEEFGYQVGKLTHLEHNGHVSMWDISHVTNEGEEFFVRGIFVDDGLNHVTLVPKEALNLLKWLQEHKEELEKEQQKYQKDNNEHH